MFVCSMDSVELVYPALLIDEVDYYWNRLSEGGDEAAQHVGWLKDKYGFSWQIVPIEYYELIQGPDLDKSRRVMNSVYKMKKFDINELRKIHHKNRN